MRTPELPMWLPVAVDTETGPDTGYEDTPGNSLYADSGARVSIVSAGWLQSGIVLAGPDAIRQAVATGVGVGSVAWPFSQGKTINGLYKPGVTPSLLDSEVPNLRFTAWTKLQRWLRDRRLVMQNSKFDLEKLRYRPQCWTAGTGVDRVDQVIWDTQVVNHILWPKYPTGLKPTARRLWGVAADAEAAALQPYLGTKDNPRYDLVDWGIIEPYAAADAALTIRLYYHQLDELGVLDGVVDSARLALCHRETSFAKLLYRMERAGVPYQAKTSLDVGVALQTEVDALDHKLPFRPTVNEAKKYLFGTGAVLSSNGTASPGLGLGVLKRTSQGAVSLTDEVLDQLITKYDENTPAGSIARDWKARNAYAGAIARWYEPYGNGTGEDGRLRCCFRQVSSGRDADGGTVSGRLSVERVNLQAIPHDYRLKAWPVATPRQIIGAAAAQLVGWELWELDLQQAELRGAAAYANCTTMLEAMASGADVHGQTTTGIFHLQPGDPEWGRMRQVGKRANFSCLFGVGSKTFAEMVAKETGLRLSLAQSEQIVHTWNAMYPEFDKANNYWKEHANRTRSMVLASVDGFWTGKKRVFTEAEVALTQSKGLSKAFNQLVQGTLAEFLRDWLLGVDRTLGEAGLSRYVEGIGWTGMVMTIHDSIVLLLPAGQAGEVVSGIQADTAALWGRYFQPDPLGRVSSVAGGCDAAQWTGDGK